MCAFLAPVSARLCGARVLDDVRRRPGSAPAKPAAKSCLAGPSVGLTLVGWGETSWKKVLFLERQIFWQKRDFGSKLG